MVAGRSKRRLIGRRWWLNFSAVFDQKLFKYICHVNNQNKN